jgi:thiamine-phosphate pyrophosphorylase
MDASSTGDLPSLENIELYGVVDLNYHLSAETAAVAAERLLEGGVDMLRLRASAVPRSILVGLAEELHAMTSALGVPLILHNDPDLLREVPAEGVHLAQEEFSIVEVRATAGRPVIIGRDAHSLPQARAVAEDGADYVSFGPLFANLEKTDHEAIGLEDLAAVNEQLSIPVFCFGGIRLENLAQARDAGARRVVMVSAWLEAKDIPAAVRSARGVLLRS